MGLLTGSQEPPPTDKQNPKKKHGPRCAGGRRNCHNKRALESAGGDYSTTVLFLPYCSLLESLWRWRRDRGIATSGRNVGKPCKRMIGRSLLCVLSLQVPPHKRSARLPTEGEPAFHIHKPLAAGESAYDYFCEPANEETACAAFVAQHILLRNFPSLLQSSKKYCYSTAV